VLGIRRCGDVSVDEEMLVLALEVHDLDARLADLGHDNPARRALQRRRMVAATRLVELEGQDGSDFETGPPAVA
jgi:hypothetical protein